MADPLVSVITPTWGPADLLFSRCIPSVAAQDYPAVEHVIVSDGPDPDLRDKLDGLPGVRFAELPEHPDAQWGHHARLHGIDIAKGEIIAYLDADNSWRTGQAGLPGHARILAAALEQSGADFAYPKMTVHGRGDAYVIGLDPPAEGWIDTSMIMHRRGLLNVATWRWYPGIPTIDWDLVSRWMAAGATWVHVPAITCDYYFHD